MMGTEFVKERGSAALNNCAFISTEDIATRGSFVFSWTMDALMVGVGVGFDAKGAERITIHEPKYSAGSIHTIPDTREGWVESLGIVLDAFFKGTVLPETMDYSMIRPEGSPIRGFGGVASGPAPLRNLHNQIIGLFNDRAGTKITSVDIVDVMNMIGACVVAGNVRRSAEIAFGNPEDTEFVTMKDYNKHPKEVKSHRWASNNSVFAEVGKTDYSSIAESIALNGEPGVIWLENMQKFGRLKDGETWADRNVRGSNPCFSPETLITTKTGVYPIEDLVGQDVDIWDGEQWVTVDNFRITGENEDMLRVELHDGSVIRTTKYHTFFLEDGTEVQAQDLKVGDQLQPSNVTGNHGTIKAQGAYVKGFLIGDGSSFMCENRLFDSIKEIPVREGVGSDTIIEPYSKKQNSAKADGSVSERKIVQGLVSRKQELYEYATAYKREFPLEVFTWDKESQAEFIAGVMDANGTASETTNGFMTNGFMYQITSVHKDWLLGFQSLLKVFGVYSKVAKNKNGGYKDFNDGYGEYLCNSTYRLTISQKGSIVLANSVKFERLRSLAHKTTTYNVKQKFNHIVSIKEDGVEDKVYCCTVPTNHKVSVACGVTTGQCSEQTLESGELCCLVETFPSRHESYEEYQETIKYAYLYGKTVTLLPTHWEETNAVLMKNRRIGTSQSGIIDAFVKHGRRTMLEWSDNIYAYLRKLDKVYSDWLAIPQSIKITSVKPSGSVSLLPGVSPGIHYPHDEYYLRRIRIPTENPLVPILKQAGYHTEPNAYGSTEEERNKTTVVSFPVHEPLFVKRKNDVSIWEQMKNLVDYQTFWADNAVSITVTFKPEEANQIQSVLEAYEDQLKAVSFLPISEHGYEQAPYESISKEEFEEYASKLSVPDFTAMTQALTAEGSVFCDGDSCEI
jgi:ribonucleotide reductase alpha subunit